MPKADAHLHLHLCPTFRALHPGVVVPAPPARFLKTTTVADPAAATPQADEPAPMEVEEVPGEAPAPPVGPPPGFGPLQPPEEEEEKKDEGAAVEPEVLPAEPQDGAVYFDAVDVVDEDMWEQQAEQQAEQQQQEGAAAPNQPPRPRVVDPAPARRRRLPVKICGLRVPLVLVCIALFMIHVLGPLLQANNGMTLSEVRREGGPPSLLWPHRVQHHLPCLFITVQSD